MPRIDDQITRFFYWLHPPLLKERDLLLAKVQDYAQRLAETEQLAAKATIEAERLKRIVEANRRPETPGVMRAKTSAEVRRIMELESLKEEEKQNGV